MADKNSLRAPLPNVVNALEELCEVLTGGAYNSAQFWGAADEAAAGAYMDSLTLNANLTSTINKVTGKVPGFAGALDSAAGAINGFINDVSETTSQVTGDVIPAITQLNTPHANGVYGTSPTDNYGFIPGILGIGNAAGLDLTGVQNAINTAVGVANDAISYAFFTVLATKTLAKLTDALGS
ncbi:MAG TPA: hypothetical protein VK464_12320 [Symbiobacteriaceae bacterium]|jgi:hypothetical protein|nr:hypothetical protein [Symbiobacteriaceae bacterium]